MKRDKSIDFMKFILVIGMIMAHVIQFFGTKTFLGDTFSLYINMITFSGFTFCFGYVCNIAYLNKDKYASKKSLMKNSIKMLMAFYISGFCYEIFIKGFDFSIIAFLKIFLLWNIPGYSEFLLSFALLSIFTYLFYDKIKKLISSKNLWLVLIVSLLFTFIPYELIKINQIGLIVGTTKFASFPIIQYLPFYLLGIYFEENKIAFKWNYIIIAIVSSSIIIIYYILMDKLPNRFPPSIVWILGPTIYIYIYYLICKKVCSKYNIPEFINIIGKNTLYFLLSSNIIIFITKYMIGDLKFNLQLCFLFSVVIIILSYLLLKLIQAKKCKYNIIEKHNI